MTSFKMFAGMTLLALGASCALASSRQADTKVTLTVQATDATHALQQLSDAGKVKLLTTPQTANETLTFRFKDVPISEAMKRIADAVDGTWRSEGETYLLIRTADQQRAERESEFEQDVESIKKRTDDLAKMPAWGETEANLLATRVQTLVKGFNPNAASNNFYQQASLLSQQAPIGRAITKIAALMDPHDLAGLPPYYKTVWSTNPTATQRVLPAGVTPIIEEYVLNQATWSAAVESHHLTAPTFGGTTYWVGDFGDFQNAGNSGKVAVVLLSAQRWSKAPMFNLELSAYDDKGKRIGQAQSNLANDYESYMEVMKDDPAQPGVKTIKLDADATALIGFQSRNASTHTKLPPDLIAKITHPESYDPLRFFLSSSLVQAAEIKDTNMVACLTDNAFYNVLVGASKDISADTFLQRLSFFYTKSELKDGWLVVKPTRASQSREDHADRKELGKYLRRISSGLPMTIDERAAFALALPDQQSNYLCSALASYLEKATNDYFDNNMLRLYGMVTSEQRAKMLSGGISFDSLTENELECVNRMVFGINSNLQYNPPPSQRENGNQIDWDLYYNGLLHEPTESLPDGIPPKGLLKLTTDNSYVVMASPSDSQPYGMRGEMDPSSLAWQKYSQEHLDLFPWMNEEMQKVDFSRLQYGKRLQMTFTFQFTPVLSLTQSFDQHDKDAFQTVALDGLPDDFKKKYSDAYANLVQSYANAKPGQFGGPAHGANGPP